MFNVPNTGTGGSDSSNIFDVQSSQITIEINRSSNPYQIRFTVPYDGIVTPLTASFTAGTTYIAHVKFSGISRSRSLTIVNGNSSSDSQSGIGTTTTTGLETMVFGFLASSVDFYVGEIIAFSGILNNSEETDCLNYLQSKWFEQITTVNSPISREDLHILYS